MEPESKGGRQRRARLRRIHRVAAIAILVAPATVILGLDVARRAKLMATYDLLHGLGYFGSVTLSVSFWAALLISAARRKGAFRFVAAGAFVCLFGFAVAVQAAFFRYYSVYCSHDAMLEYRSVPTTWTCALPWDARSLLGAYLPVCLLLGASLVYAAHRFVRARRVVARGAPLLSVGLAIAIFAVPVSYRRLQSSMFDHIYFNAMAISFREQIPYTRRVPIARTQRRTPDALPRLSPGEGGGRNVLFILQESEREDSVCSEYTPECNRPGRIVNKVLPDRLGLSRMRAVASSTVISSSVLLSGFAPTEDFATLHRVPYLWAYAKAAGYSTAYWTSQHVMLFGMRFVAQDQPLDLLTVGTHLDMGADGDMGANDALLSDRVIQELPTLKEPFFAVAQYANVHYPYLIDESDAPYGSPDDSKRKEQWHRYQNAVYTSDHAMARLLTWLRDSDVGKRTVVVFTSDHGESFWEHGSEGHTKTVFDAEIRVPGWIWAAPNVLTPTERGNLRAARVAPTFHLDLAPTMLDLMGLWDAPGIAKYRARMPGHPLTRGERTTEPVALTNCSWIWQCKNASIGLIQFPMKIAARGKDEHFDCFNVKDDPQEKADLGEEACGDLVSRAHEIFGYMPSDVTPNLNPPR